MIESRKIELTKDNVINLNINDIIYSEIAASGAMGNAGGVMVYIFVNSEFILYHTNVFDNKLVYQKIRELLFQGQEEKQSCLNYHYGGMGNHAFTNKNFDLIKEESHFVFKTKDSVYKILPSVNGVFELVSHSLEKSKLNN